MLTYANLLPCLWLPHTSQSDCMLSVIPCSFFISSMFLLSVYVFVFLRVSFFLLCIYSTFLLHALLIFSLFSNTSILIFTSFHPVYVLSLSVYLLLILTYVLYSMWIVSTVHMVQLHYICTFHSHPPTVFIGDSLCYIYIVFIMAKCTGDNLWRWFEREKNYNWCFALLCLN